MNFTIEKPVPESLRPVIDGFCNAVEYGLPNAGLCRAFVHVGRDDQNRDIIYFEVHDSLSGHFTLPCATDESPAVIQRRAHDKWSNMVHQSGVKHSPRDADAPSHAAGAAPNH
jgi:hypothetical protein